MLILYIEKFKPIENLTALVRFYYTSEFQAESQGSSQGEHPL